MVVIIVVTIYKEYFHLLWRVCRPCRKRRPCCCCWVPSFSPQLSSAADQCSPLNCCSKEFSEVWNTVNTDISIFRIQCFLKLSAMWKCVAQELQYAMRRAGQNPTDVEVRDGLNFLFKSICQHLDLGERDNSAFSPFFFCKCNFLCVQPLNNKMDNMFFEVGFLQDPFIPMQAYWQRELCRFKIWSTRLTMAPPRSTSRSN